MGLKNLIKRIPFVKKFLIKREQKNNKKALMEIENAIQTIENRSYTAKDLVNIKNVTETLCIAPDCIKRVGPRDIVSFYSISSQSGLEAIMHKCYGRETLSRTNYMELQKIDKQFNMWFSNIESIGVLLGFHEAMLEKAIWLESPEKTRKEYYADIKIKEEEEIYLNSILYRLGLLDYLQLLLLLIEGKNEILEQQTNHTG